MNMKKLAVAAAVTAAIGGAAPAFASVTGVPGEALLVPLVLNDPITTQGTGGMNTYVQIRVPTTLGQDFVLNTYTAPNVAPAPGEPLVNQATSGADFTIHWVVYDHRSRIVTSGSCETSAGDSVLWSTDSQLRNLQTQTGLNVAGAPDADCGPNGGLGLNAFGGGRIGYVVFQTNTAADGLAADFAMEGSAWITDPAIRVADTGSTASLLSVPVMAMADGEDPDDATDATPPALGMNEVIINTQSFTKNDGQPGDPSVVAPLATGVRMNNGDNATNDPFHLAGGVQGSYGNQGQSLHAFWFDRNDDARSAYWVMWDAHEENCNSNLPLPHEVNLWVYNKQLTNVQAAGVWSAITGSVADTYISDLVTALASTATNTYTSGNYCLPPNWNQTIMGYAQYTIPEQGDDDGMVSSAGVAFEAQEDDQHMDAWARHMMTARGFH